MGKNVIKYVERLLSCVLLLQQQQYCCALYTYIFTCVIVRALINAQCTAFFIMPLILTLTVTARLQSDLNPQS